MRSRESSPRWRGRPPRLARPVSRALVAQVTPPRPAEQARVPAQPRGSSFDEQSLNGPEILVRASERRQAALFSIGATGGRPRSSRATLRFAPSARENSGWRLPLPPPAQHATTTFPSKILTFALPPSF